LKTPAFADGIWAMFDYNRGYAPDIEASGVMDIFRLPKFGYWFFRSQRDAKEMVAGQLIGPLVFIANYWTLKSPLEVRVFSNCEEVALYLNGKLLERRPPDTSRTSTHLKHPPFTFHLAQFQAGTLRAVGYIGGREAALSEVRTPGSPAKMTLRFDTAGKRFAANGEDVLFCYAELRDKEGTVVPNVEAPVFFGKTSKVGLVGSNPILSEAGTATTLLRTDKAQPGCAVYAIALIKDEEQTRILCAAASPEGVSPPRCTIHYTTDGSAPTSASPRYSNPLANVPHLRVALLVQGQSVAIADSRSNAASTRGIEASTAKTAAN
jgi:hypothetical protein